LNHVELVYRPGERELAARVFALLGCRPVDRGGTFFTSFVEPAETDFSNNVFYASEVTPEQWCLEQALDETIRADNGPVASTTRVYLERLRREPQRSFHFGVRYPSLDALETTCSAIRSVDRTDPGLAGRIEVSGVFHPGGPGAYTDTMVQAFVHTDVVAAGLLVLGQHIELQWQLPPATG